MAQATRIGDPLRLLSSSTSRYEPFPSRSPSSGPLLWSELAPHRRDAWISANWQGNFSQEPDAKGNTPSDDLTPARIRWGMDSLARGAYPGKMLPRHVGLLVKWADEGGIRLSGAQAFASVSSTVATRSLLLSMTAAFAAVMCALSAGVLMSAILGLVNGPGLPIPFSLALFWTLVAIAVESGLVARRSLRR